MASIPVGPHCANARRITCQQADLNSLLLQFSKGEGFPLGELEETTGTLLWMKTTQQELKSMNLSLNEATDVAQNRPLWRMMSMFGTRR